MPSVASPQRQLEAIERARSLMAEGASLRSAAAIAGAEFGVSESTIRLWAKHLGTPLTAAPQVAAKTEAARGALQVYTLERRRALLAKFFQKIEGLLDGAQVTSEVKDLAVTVGILIDKARLEEGDATVRTETIDRTARVEDGRQFAAQLRRIA